MNIDQTEALLRREKAQKEKKKRRKRLALIGAGLLLLVLAGLIWALLWGPLRRGAGKNAAPLPLYSEESLPGETARIQLIDVGQGLGILIESGGEAMLIDGGGGRASSKTVAILKARGVSCLKYLLVTHYDEDHLGGAVGALAAIGTRQALGPDYEKEGRTVSSFFRRLEEAGITLIHPQPGDSYPLGLCEFTVLGPLSIREDGNDNSILLRFSDGTSSLLITGDAGEAAEKDAANRWKKALKSDILVVGHHGSHTSSTAEFLKRVKPAHLLLSCGEGNEYGHPHQAVMDRLKDLGADLRRSDKQGDIRFVFTPQGIVWELPPSQDWSAGKGKAKD